jgi:hypothetical protein
MASYPDGRKNYAPGYFSETLLQAANGKLYGTAALSGAQRAGAIFELSLDGTYKVLHEFPDFRNGSPDFLTEASDGNLYGVTEGETQLGGVNLLYRISPAGIYEELGVMSGAKIGNCPCWLTQGSDGKFYGTAMWGGPGLGSAWVWDLGLPKPLPTLHGPIPTSGTPGSQVIIWGDHLLGTTGVSFNGTAATAFSNITGNYVSVTVPAGAVSGPVTIATPNGTATSTTSFNVQ